MTTTVWSKLNLPVRAAAAYAIAATLWIVVTDGLVAAIWQHAAREWMTDLGKGLLFVGASTLFFYLLVERLVARFEQRLPFGYCSRTPAGSRRRSST